MFQRILFTTGLILAALLSYGQPYSGFLSLDGSDDFAERSSAAAVLPAGQDFTVEGWIRSCGLRGCLLDARDPISGDGLSLKLSEGGSLRLRMQGGSTSLDTLLDLPLSSTFWQHLALTWNQSTGIAELFLGGKPSGQFAGGFSPAAVFSLGRDQATGADYFDGYLEEFRVSNTIRYTGPFNPNGPFSPDAATLGLWHFDEPMGSTMLTDASGMGHNLQPRMGASTAAPFAVSGGGAICPGAELLVAASGGVSYSWSPVDGLDDPTSPSPMASPEATTYYVVSAMDSNSCVSMGLVVVEVRPLPEAIATAAQPLICAGSVTQLFAEGGMTFMWSTGDISQNPFVEPETSTTYTVQVTDAFGCSAEASVRVEVEECETTTGLESAVGFSLHMGPNPTWGSLWLNLALAQPGQASIRIFDSRGALVRQYSPEHMASGLHQKVLDTGLGTGNYYLVLDLESEQHSRSFTVLR